MNDHNLDDLIIDNIEPKNAKAKSLLTVVALFIVVLIVGIILTSVIFDDSQKDQDLASDAETEMISPELTLQNATKVKEPKAEPKLNEIIEEELNKPVKTAKKEETTLVAPAIVTEQPAEESKPVPAAEPTVEKPEAKSVPITEEFKQTEPKTTPHEPVAAPAPIEKKEKMKPKPVAQGNFYIQVGAYSKSPSKRLISSIKNNGFHYAVVKRNGMNKVLIGPFADRPAVNSALVRVRDHINKQAFVVTK